MAPPALLRLFALSVCIASASAAHLPGNRAAMLQLVADMQSNANTSLGLLARMSERGAAETFYRALERAHSFEGTNAGSGRGGHVVNGNFVEGYSHPSEGLLLRDLVRTLGSSRKEVQVCEIGFNAGHSAANYLILNLFGQRVRYVGFDLGEHAYAHSAQRFLKSLFGDLIQVVWGDSERTLTDFRTANPGFVCDLAMVDGLHTYDAALTDSLNFLPLTRAGSVLAMDDMGMPELRRAWAEVERLCPAGLTDQGCRDGGHWCHMLRTEKRCPDQARKQTGNELRRLRKLKLQAQHIAMAQGKKSGSGGWHPDETLQEKIDAKISRLESEQLREKITRRQKRHHT